MSAGSLITLENLEALATVIARKFATMLEVVTEKHTLTSEELEQGYFELERSVITGHENEVLLFIGGVLQVAGVDFVASGNRISWLEKGLDEVGLKAGDVFVVQYKS